MAQREIDPFEIGRRGLAVPFREFPIWFACAFWPFALTIGGIVLRARGGEIPPVINAPAGWIAGAIFDWCWMTALARNTTIQLITFPAAPSFWLFVVLKLGLSAASWIFSGLLSLVLFAALDGEMPYLDLSGPLVQVGALMLAPLLLSVGIWVALRLMIWPAHCAASGRLAAPKTIWSGMQDHSFDALVICVIAASPYLVMTIGELVLARTTEVIARLDPVVLNIIDAVTGTYSNGAFDAAMLVAYTAIFGSRARR
jgi:hypothetical protein